MSDRSVSGFLRDNIEAFAVAIAMALVIRHYCLEAFRIPTASMQPTLMGDHVWLDGSTRHGDRILVDKFVYLRRDPRRYEVVVFKYPLNTNKNFIKRLAGLPGEWLQIVDGDLWVSTDKGKLWTICRKPRGVRDQLFTPYYPEPFREPDAFKKVSAWDHEDGWSLDEVQRVFSVDAPGISALTFARRVVTFPDVDGEYGSSNPEVGDVRVRFGLEVERAGTLVVRLQEGGWPHRLVLGKDESFLVVARDKEERFPIDVRLKDGMSLDVSFANVDDSLVLEIDGEETVIEFPNQPTDPKEIQRAIDDEGRLNLNEIAIVAQGFKGVLSDLAIERDLRYERRNHGEPWKIPADHFFMLGDNTHSSYDSREWTICEAYPKDGSAPIRWEVRQEGVDNPACGRAGDRDEIIVNADVDGLVRRVKSADIGDWRSGVPYSFVPRDHLVGRAFAVFWPIYVPPAYTGPTRIKLIR